MSEQGDVLGALGATDLVDGPGELGLMWERSKVIYAQGRCCNAPVR